jgi:hypothetical protein
MSEDSRYLCTDCYGGYVPLKRWQLGYTTCLQCGDVRAKARKFTVAPMHKSNYMLFTDMNDLKGINNKGGLIK